MSLCKILLAREMALFGNKTKVKVFSAQTSLLIEALCCDQRTIVMSPIWPFEGTATMSHTLLRPLGQM